MVECRVRLRSGIGWIVFARYAKRSTQSRAFARPSSRRVSGRARFKESAAVASRGCRASSGSVLLYGLLLEQLIERGW